MLNAVRVCTKQQKGPYQKPPRNDSSAEGRRSGRVRVGIGVGIGVRGSEVNRKDTIVYE